VSRLVGLVAAGVLLAACSGCRPSPAAPPPGAPSSRPEAAATRSSTTVATTTTAPTATTHAPVRPATAAGRLAAELTRAETAIRDPATPASRLPALGRAQQRAYRALVRQPRLAPEVLRRVPASLRPTVKANTLAGAELRGLSRPASRLPRWRIVAPAPAAELLASYHAAGAKLGVPWQYLAAIHLVETRVGRIRGLSSAGARGPMQFLPATWRRYGGGGDIDATGDAVLAAARLLRANGAPHDMAGALHAYNPSRRYVRAVTAYAEQIRADPRAYLGYYHWQVYYGDILLPEGYPATPDRPLLPSHDPDRDTEPPKGAR
jgi:membrane-bound lytic murein transglycosylase B